MGIKPCKGNKGYRQMDAEKPFKGKFSLSCPEISKKNIEHKGDDTDRDNSQKARRYIHTEKYPISDRQVKKSSNGQVFGLRRNEKGPDFSGPFSVMLKAPNFFFRS